MRSKAYWDKKAAEHEPICPRVSHGYYWAGYPCWCEAMREERARIGRLVHDIGRALLSGSKDDQVRGAYCLVLAQRIRSNTLEGALDAHGITPASQEDSPAEGG